MNPTMLDRVQGCFMGVLLGDVLGMPVEMMMHNDILVATNGKGVTGFDSFGKIDRPRLREHAIGDWTDDWQLTAAVTRSIIARGEYDFLACALAQLQEYRKTMFGWGGTTKHAFAELDVFFASAGMRGRSPFTRATSSDPKRGNGNGVAMKVAPLAIYVSLPYRGCPEHLFQNFGFLTHSDPRAGTAAFALAMGISDALEDSFSSDDFLTNLIARVSTYQISSECDFMFTEKAFIREEDWRVHVETARNISAFAPESVAFALNVFCKYQDDFRGGVLAAINAGGDTDTTGSMTGALIGARVGIHGIPEEWRNFRPEYQEALTLGQQLYDVCSR